MLQSSSDIRALVGQVTIVTIHDCNSAHRCVLSNRQQWFAHRRLDTSNSGIDSPMVAQPSTPNRLSDLACAPVAVRKVRSTSPGLRFPYVAVWGHAVFPAPVSTPILIHSNSRTSTASTLKQLMSNPPISTSSSPFAGFVESRL